MKWPRLNRQPLRTVTVPELSGGVNMRDAVTLVKDNQLTDSLNMWYKDNILKTRPLLNTGLGMEYNTTLSDPNANGKPLDIFVEKNNKIYRLYQCSERELLWFSENDIVEVKTFDTTENISFVTEGKIIKNGQEVRGLYVFLQNKSIYRIAMCYLNFACVLTRMQNQ